MRVEDMRVKAEKVRVKDVEFGECFIDWDDELNMKVESNSNYNAMVLSTGLLWVCDGDALVLPVKTHIVIESEE